jgi:hypothetical protein
MATLSGRRHGGENRAFLLGGSSVWEGTWVVAALLRLPVAPAACGCRSDRPLLPTRDCPTCVARQSQALGGRRVLYIPVSASVCGLRVADGKRAASTGSLSQLCRAPKVWDGVKR